MIKVLLPVIFTIIAIAFFSFALYFSKYKKGKSGCCGGDVYSGYNGKTCDKDEKKICICK